MNRALIIGVSGATCSGKTSLIQLLTKCLPNGIGIHQDDYYFPVDSPRHQVNQDLGHINWELVSAFDMDKLVKQVLDKATALEQTPRPRPKPILPLDQVDTENDLKQALKHISHLVILLDGITLFNDPKCAEMCDLKYFLTLDHDECARRRQGRSYDPPDVPGYFETVVWPHYEANFNKVKAEVTNITYLEGKTSTLNHAKTIAADLIKLWNDNK